MGGKRTKKIGSTRGFEARYGVGVRKRYIEVLSGLKKTYSCPKCRSKSVRRQSIGLWACKKCSLIFTGGAYVPTTKLGVMAKRAARGGTREIITNEDYE